MLNEATSCGSVKRPENLSPAILSAICHLVARKTGATLSYEYEQAIAEEIDHNQLSIALAYASLCMEEPDMVTSHHLKMLRAHFSYEQIQALSTFIKSLLAKG